MPDHLRCGKMTTCKHCGILLTLENAHTWSAGRKGYHKIAGWCKDCHDKVVLGGICVNEGCTNPRAENRRLCHHCANIRKNERRRNKNALGTHGCNVGCPQWVNCNRNKLWLKCEPIPCEELLEDEIAGCQYEPGTLPVSSIPNRVSINISFRVF